MTDVVTTRRRLGEQANELDLLSALLGTVEDALAESEEEYRKFVDDFEIGLYFRSENEDDFRLPSEAMRLKLAHQAMPPEQLGRYMGLVAQRKKHERRIRDLKASVDANRSILSALKSELEAGSSGIGRAA